jgi:hypothetical protein
MIKIFFPILIAVSSFHTKSAWAHVPQEAYTFDYNVDMTNMERRSEEKVLKSLELLREVLATDEFRRRVLDHQFRGGRAFSYNNGLSNKQVYAKIFEGAEILYPVKNNMMDLEVRLYTDHNSNTIGYTWPLSFKIWMNTKYFYKRRISQIAGTLVHEWLHKLGFDHEREFTAERNYTIPYAIGNLVQEIADKMLRDRESLSLTPR